MAAVQRFSTRVIDYAERLSGMADAAEGKRTRRGHTLRRLTVLPASGAALYALIRSDAVSRQAKEVIDGAKTRASELPDDLMSRVRETVVEQPAGNGSPRRQPTRARASKSSPSRKSKSRA